MTESTRSAVGKQAVVKAAKPAIVSWIDANMPEAIGTEETITLIAVDFEKQAPGDIKMSGVYAAVWSYMTANY